MKKLIWLIIAIILLGILFFIPGEILVFIPKILGAIVLILALITLAIFTIAMLLKFELLYTLILGIITIGLAMGIFELLPAWF